MHAPARVRVAAARPVARRAGNGAAHLRPGVERRARLEQQRHDVDVAAARGEVERRDALIVPRVARRMRLDEEPHDLQPLLGDRQVQWRVALDAAVERRAGVDQQRGDLEVASPRRVVERRAAILCTAQASAGDALADMRPGGVCYACCALTAPKASTDAPLFTSRRTLLMSLSRASLTSSISLVLKLTPATMAVWQLPGESTSYLARTGAHPAAASNETASCSTPTAQQGQFELWEQGHVLRCSGGGRHTRGKWPMADVVAKGGV
eukprot:2703209-Prymnesium_polylepis.1